ncbi:hypothetical protein TcYC6_0017790 [Trypanosoma cruzi]|uniref:Uncharacterized protein n=2 Tax=Trypanosoma cruzi TaxID=5693 RepID=Q4CP36_TRYCC|nr:hypothetical protein, conserved [Trypanosoma cruzi]EAN82037.1 hypothetical protein, conserved [Trypanosoma cruzi]KAF5226088.1 hypothetical protein ECC02_000649 [Trypanosoma cruzi]KAF8277091.1 hypothetical protein TcYC6_0017790 [Trypanosoma cruzi]|eukprot:XP_803888.1 hypothetical protein [Trypanosoma cruzi strain CL Brener]
MHWNNMYSEMPNSYQGTFSPLPRNHELFFVKCNTLSHHHHMHYPNMAPYQMDGRMLPYTACDRRTHTHMRGNRQWYEDALGSIKKVPSPDWKGLCALDVGEGNEEKDRHEFYWVRYDENEAFENGDSHWNDTKNFMDPEEGTQLLPTFKSLLAYGRNSLEEDGKEDARSLQQHSRTSAMDDGANQLFRSRLGQMEEERMEDTRTKPKPAKENRVSLAPSNLLMELVDSDEDSSSSKSYLSKQTKDSFSVGSRTNSNKKDDGDEYDNYGKSRLYNDSGWSFEKDGTSLTSHLLGNRRRGLEGSFLNNAFNASFSLATPAMHQGQSISVFGQSALRGYDESINQLSCLGRMQMGGDDVFFRRTTAVPLVDAEENSYENLGHSFPKAPSLKARRRSDNSEMTPLPNKAFSGLKRIPNFPASYAKHGWHRSSLPGEEKPNFHKDPPWISRDPEQDGLMRVDAEKTEPQRARRASIPFTSFSFKDVGKRQTTAVEESNAVTLDAPSTSAPETKQKPQPQQKQMRETHSPYILREGQQWPSKERQGQLPKLIQRYKFWTSHKNEDEGEKFSIPTIYETRRRSQPEPVRKEPMAVGSPRGQRQVPVVREQLADILSVKGTERQKRNGTNVNPSTALTRRANQETTKDKTEKRSARQEERPRIPTLPSVNSKNILLAPKRRNVEHDNILGLSMDYQF